MATFGDLKTRIADKLIDDSLSSQIATAINNAIKYYQHERLWFNEVSEEITLSSGDPVVPDIPDDFLYEVPERGLVISYNGLRYPLHKVSGGEYDAMNNETEAMPCVYASRTGQIEVYPYPDQDYTLILPYLKKYDDLVSDNDSNDWTNYGERVIEAKALADIWLDYRHEPEVSAIFGAKASDELERIKTLTNSKLTTGRLVTEDFTDIGDYYYA